MEYQPDTRRITGEGGVISQIEPGGIAEELGLQPGDVVLAIDGFPLRDVIDYRFAIADERIELLAHGADGETIYEIEKDPDDDLGIEFAEPLFDRLRTCNNKCPFCFLTQMPKGMRKTLYLKDDDYRLSFLYANFVTLTNLDEADWRRIETQHLSPLHISVHATDQALRAVLLGKRDVPDVLAQIRRLGDAGVSVHTQVVACPGLNDGATLHQTVQGLAALYPVVQSIAVVPVGLTRFRFAGKRPQSVRAAIQVHESPEWIDTNWEPQPLWDERAPQSHNDHPLYNTALGYCSRLGAATDVPLRCYTPDEAAQLIDLIEPYARRCQHELGLHLVYPSDEFYLLCNRPPPPADFYDGMPQYSNGVGMTRDFLDSWAKAQRRLPTRLRQPSQIALVCGTLIAPLMQHIVERLNQIKDLHIQLVPVINRFFGETVTVSGLLTAQDVIPALSASGCTRAILPRVMFDYQGEHTLDNYSLRQIGEAARMPVTLAGDPEELVRLVRSLIHSE